MSTPETLEADPGSGPLAEMRAGPDPGQVILVHSGAGNRAIADRLGTADYSYYFVLREFLPALERIGRVVHVRDPESEVDALYADCRARGIPCTFLSFAPPHRTPVGLRCPTIPVFAWEFRDIPHDPEPDTVEADWTRVLGRTGWAITHSRFAADAVRASMRPDFPVESIPAPLWDRFERIRKEEASTGGNGRHRLERRLGGPILDTREIDLSDFAPKYAKQAMGMGREARTLPPLPVREDADLSTDAVVYTSIFNPYDGRKNWRDLVGVFCQVLRDADDATLILKLTHSNPVQSCYSILEELYKSSPFSCRVLIQHGFLDVEAYEHLIRLTDYAVNASHGEGQCLPVMEFMSAGKPAIAPRHTAFSDYVTPSNAFVVDSSPEPAAWPHDPRQVYRTVRERIDPESLARAYEESYGTAKLRPDRYRRMSMSAIRGLGAHCSVDVAAAKLRKVLALRNGEATVFGDELPEAAAHARLADLRRRLEAGLSRSGTRSPSDTASPPPSTPGEPDPSPDFGEERLPPAHRDPRACGLKDAVLSGWYRGESGELLEGFRITSRDRVLDVGCGAGGATRFCAEAGAETVFLDLDPGKVEATLRGLAPSPGKARTPLVGRAEAIPLPDGSVTKVVCMDVLEHVDDPARALAEMARVGRPEARYLLSVPDPAGERLQERFAPRGHFAPPNHLRIFEREELAGLVEASGLEVETHRFTGFYWTMAMCLYWASQDHLSEPEGKETLSRIRPPFPEVMERWAATWDAFLSLPGHARTREALDRFLPKNQVILARKPSDR